MAQKQETTGDGIRVLDAPGEIAAREWNALLALQSQPTPFMRHEYVAAMHESGSAVRRTGWTPRFVTLWRGGQLQAACALYLKAHSYGEYVFDWAWANAYQQHGVAYYPKAVIAAPFTPVPGSRLLARDDASRVALVRAAVDWCQARKLSSLHLLFGSDADIAACTAAGLMPRHTVQFHWNNTGYPDFDAFLASLSQEKRKKIRQERRKVAEAGVTFRWAVGADIAPADWDFFYTCYERTYYEHGNAPYLTRSFFARMEADMPEHWLLFTGERDGKPVTTSLIALNPVPERCAGTFPSQPAGPVAYGRYWGATERVDCLHFEACYYQPLAWCIQHGYARFEGGAQGEHKMARALMPVQTSSAHWLAHPAFAEAIERFLEREGRGIEHYMESLEQRTPFRQGEN